MTTKERYESALDTANMTMGEVFGEAIKRKGGMSLLRDLDPTGMLIIRRLPEWLSAFRSILMDQAEVYDLIRVQQKEIEELKKQMAYQTELLREIAKHKSE